MGRKQIASSAALVTKTLGISSEMSEDRNAAKEPTEAFWNGENPQFFSWLKTNGVSWPQGKVPKYAEGGDGRAYFVGKFVVKFTRDRAGANVANMCIGVPFAPAPVISVWRVPGRPLWAILQKLVSPEKVPGEMKKAADYLSAWIDENPNLDHFPTERAAQEKMAGEVLRAFNGPKTLIPSLVILMGVHNRLYFSTGFTHTDGGPTNISVGDSGDIVYHDLGPNMTKDYNPRPVLDKIHANRKRLGLPDVKEV